MAVTNFLLRGWLQARANLVPEAESLDGRQGFVKMIKATDYGYHVHILCIYIYIGVHTCIHTV